MTAPVDPTPYALPTDLVTAADVLAWLEERTPRPHPPEYMIRYAVDDLRARLDRERRQACRQGAHAMFREAIMWRAAERESCRGETWAAVYRERRARRLASALAFRAAARAK